MEKCRVVRLVNVEPQKSIIIDTHGGIEDIIGIMSAIQLAKLYDKTILGITCVNGRRNVHDAASDALLAIKLCNANIPIYLGIKNFN
jgi:inosine-uridine nucleoside N-ribohydrolase